MRNGPGSDAADAAEPVACIRQSSRYSRTLLVRDAFARERESLTALPAAPFPHHEIRPARIDRTCHARFDTNDYSVPPDFAKARLTLAVDRDTVRILDGVREVALHRRCYDRKRPVTDPEHARAIAARKRQARSMSVRDRLLRAVPRAEGMLARAGSGGRNVSSCARMLAELLDAHGADETDRAVAAALERGSCHPETVRAIIEERRREQGLPPVSIADSGRDVHGTTPRGTGLGAYDRPAKREGDGT